MNRFPIGFIVLFILNINIYSQEKITTEFYSVEIPDKTTTKVFDKSHEEFANVDVYQFTIDKKPKYIFYLMSNKTNDQSLIVDLENYKDFLFDLGDINILDVEKFENKIKINYIYNDKKNIKGIIYVNIKGNILNRFIFLLPNESAKNTFGKEIDEMVKKIIEIRNNW